MVSRWSLARLLVGALANRRVRPHWNSKGAAFWRYAREPLPVRVQSGDLGPGTNCYTWSTDGSTQVLLAKIQVLKGVNGTYLRWDPDSTRFASILGPQEEGGAAASVCINTFGCKQGTSLPRIGGIV